MKETLTEFAMRKAAEAKREAHKIISETNLQNIEHFNVALKRVVDKEIEARRWEEVA